LVSICRSEAVYQAAQMGVVDRTRPINGFATAHRQLVVEPIDRRCDLFVNLIHGGLA
jgi:hypothetical protein